MANQFATHPLNEWDPVLDHDIFIEPKESPREALVDLEVACFQGRSRWHRYYKMERRLLQQAEIEEQEWKKQREEEQQLRAILTDPSPSLSSHQDTRHTPTDPIVDDSKRKGKGRAESL